MRKQMDRAINWWFAQTTLTALTPTTTAEREFARKSRLLSIVLLIDLVSLLPVAMFYSVATWSIVTLSLWIFITVVTTTLIINRQGHLKSAAYFYLLGVGVAAFFGAWSRPNIDSGSALWQGVDLGITPIAAGLFLPFWAPFLFAGVECLVLTSFLFLPTLHSSIFLSLQSQIKSPTFLLNAVLLTFTFALIGALYAHSTEKAVHEADRAAELTEAHTQLAAAYTQMETLATTDPITGVLNHRAFNERLAHAVREAERDSQALGLIFADIDHFKQVNDTWGHQVGDAALAHVGAILRQVVGAVGGTVARYGGEEFVILLPRHDYPQMAQLAEHLRAQIAATPCCDTLDQPLHVTASLGAALYPDDASSPDRLVQAADSAMYQAKARGRNCLCLVADVQAAIDKAA